VLRGDLKHSAASSKAAARAGTAILSRAVKAVGFVEGQFGTGILAVGNT
jgi:hypothetical protein